MKFFKCSDRKKRLERRKQKLGEKFTSDWTWRKFSIKQLAKLNPTINFENNVDSIYEIGWCNGQEKVLENKKSTLIVMS